MYKCVCVCVCVRACVYLLHAQRLVHKGIPAPLHNSHPALEFVRIGQVSVGKWRLTHSGR